MSAPAAQEHHDLEYAVATSVEPLEAAVVLESAGVNDRVARGTFGARDVFALAGEAIAPGRPRPADRRPEAGAARARRADRPHLDVLAPAARCPLRRSRRRHAHVAAVGRPGRLRPRPRRPRPELGVVLRRRQHRVDPPRQPRPGRRAPLPAACAGRRLAARRGRGHRGRVHGADRHLDDAGRPATGPAPHRPERLPPGGGHPAHDRPRAAAARRGLPGRWPLDSG